MTARKNAPVIIKRKKIVAGGGHHGGAWKVAYADFVTAMMAFFLLMWLLGATTEKQRKGIADYFNPTVPVVKASGGGSGAFGGDSIFSDNRNSRNGTGAVSSAGDADSGQETADASGEGQALKEEDFEVLQNALLGIGGETMIDELLRRHVVTRISDEGLVIELFETEDARLFDAANQPTDILTLLLDTIVPVIRLVENDLAVEAHTKTLPIVLRENNAWDRTSVRADAMRVALEASDWPGDRIKRLAGYADRQVVTENPTDARNNRVEIIVLREPTE